MNIEARQLLREEREGAVFRLTLDDPGRLNALSTAMISALHGALDRVAEDRTIKVIILSAEGRAFCAGHDLKEIRAARTADDGGRAAFAALFDACSALMLRIRDLPQPVIVEVQGVAAAAGCQLVATCDMAVASTEARFGVNGVDIGLFCSTPMVALSRNVPRKVAFEMLTTGGFLSAEDALERGLVNRIAPAETLREETDKLAAKVAEKLGRVVKIGKEAFYRQLEMPLEDAYDYTGDVIVENLLFRETEEGIAAFIEKRPPSWAEDD